MRLLVDTILQLLLFLLFYLIVIERFAEVYDVDVGGVEEFEVIHVDLDFLDCLHCVQHVAPLGEHEILFQGD